MQPLDLFNAPLTDISLIEASAGTGKTYTIAGLYLRLVVEARQPVNRILVVTYTNAATEELRDRVRQRLVITRESFIQGYSEDPFCRQLLTHCETLEIDRESAIRRLNNAVRGFDEAAIYTIHGFCQRVLADSAFESGMPFETELLTDEREILQEIVDDFWRREFYQASPLLLDYLLDQGYSPESLLQEIRPHVNKPYLKLLGPSGPPDSGKIEHIFAQAYDRVRILWLTERENIVALLVDPALNGSKYRQSSIPGWLALMDDYLAAEAPNPRLFQRFEKFTAQYLATAVKKGQRPPEHAFFRSCDALQEAHNRLAENYQWRLLEMRGQLLDYANRELTIRKRHKRVQSYNDLLSNLHRGLTSHRGKELADMVRHRYSAALIDEFQDTDPIQYAIFRRIYAKSGLPVFLVGDPKQAIYSFRGADIFAYLTARQDAAQHYTLDVNWRAHPGMIEALNALLGKTNHPFLFEDIPLKRASSADISRQSLMIQGQEESPLHLWFLGQDANGKPLSKGQASEQVARATAAEIARLLNLGATGAARLGKRPLEGGDIAVLVRSHHQGRSVRQHLMRLGVPSVQQAQDNIFASRETLELHWLLLAIAEPGYEPGVRAALTTECLGMDGETLHQLSEDEKSWEACLQDFRDYQHLWREHGFIRMFREILRQWNIAERLLSFKDGERRLTNLLHLGELLQAKASQARIGMEGLIKWLTERRQSQVSEDEEQQLRLESDEHLVKIVTIHKSKGLEYPIVFCPFAWDGRWQTDKDETVSFHNPADPVSVFLDLGSDRREQHRLLARREEAAENLRLVYVALTRAKYRCYLAWGAINGIDKAAPAWLWHQPSVIATGKDPLTATAERVQKMNEAALRNELEQIVQQANDTIQITPPPFEETTPYRPPVSQEPHYSARTFNGPLRGKWRINSFTALTAGFGTELPDYDPGPTEDSAATPEEATTIFTFPKGAQAGRCLHLIFERLDFTQSDRPALEALVERTLAEHGFDPKWVSVVADMVERVLTTPLLENGLALSKITQSQRLNELEFYYPMTGMDSEALRRILLSHGFDRAPFQDAIEQFDFNSVQGYMKGFIDLVFKADGRYYLVDYKSNWLGREPQNYQASALENVMASESYYLQYLIYSIALHRYLQWRLQNYRYEKHFGGIFYLFLRGMNPAWGSDYGIFQDRPPRALIKTLDEYLHRGSPLS